MPRSRIVRGSTTGRLQELAERITMLEARVQSLERNGTAAGGECTGGECTAFVVEDAAEREATLGRLYEAAERERARHMPAHIATALTLGESTRDALYGDAPPIDPGPMGDASPDDDFDAAEFIPDSNSPPPAIPADAMDAIASFAATVDSATVDSDSDGTVVEEPASAADSAAETIDIPLQDGGSIVLRTDADFTQQLRNLRNSELRQLSRALEVPVDRSANKAVMVETIANFLMS